MFCRPFRVVLNTLTLETKTITNQILSKYIFKQAQFKTVLIFLKNDMLSIGNSFWVFEYI